MFLTAVEFYIFLDRSFTVHFLSFLPYFCESKFGGDCLALITIGRWKCGVLWDMYGEGLSGVWTEHARNEE